MSVGNGEAGRTGLRGWWASPPRRGLRRVINPWEYRHLRGFAITHIAGGSLAAAAGVVCLSYAAYGWAAFFVAVAALNVAAGCWYLAIVRSQLPEA